MKNLASDLLFILAFPLILVAIIFLIFGTAWLYTTSKTLGAFAGILLISTCDFLAVKTISFNCPKAG